MQLSLDRTLNQFVIDGTPAQGSRRWECLVLATLIQGQHRTATTACGAAVLNSTLAEHGQKVPLTRKQWSLVWKSIDGMFTAAGRPQALALRLQHAPRKATVGPWWWQTQPGDAIKLTGVAALSRDFPLPGLSIDSNAESEAAICARLLFGQSFISEGQLDNALGALSDEQAWRWSTPELHALIQLRKVEVHALKRDFPAARDCLQIAEQLICQAEVAEVYLGPTLTLLRHRIDYAEDATVAHQRILAALSPQVRMPPGTGLREADARTRGLMFNLLALCERRWIEQHASRQPQTQLLAHAKAAMQLWSAALFCFFSSNQHEHVQNMCANIGYLHQRLCDLGVVGSPADALDWYALAQAWHNRFDLPDNSVWEYIFIGDFWLGRQDVRDLMQEPDALGTWAGRHPGTLHFYEFSLQRAEEIGDPRQTAHAALNMWRFCRAGGSFASIRDAKAKLESVLDTYPGLRELLVAEGYSPPRRR